MKLAVLAVLALAGVAHAAPSVPHAPGSARHALLAARAECAHPGARIASLLERYFDPSAFGQAVIDGWKDLTDDQRATFDALADQVVGGEERARAIARFCVKHAHVERGWEQAPGLWFVDVRDLDDDEGDCTHLMFRDDGDRWTYDGEWFCGKSIFAEEWRRKLGGTDAKPAPYDAAIGYLRMHATPAPAP